MSRLESLRRLAEARRKALSRGPSLDEIEALVRRASRKRPPGMAPALDEPPRGPTPLQGGAAAPLEFD